MVPISVPLKIWKHRILTLHFEISPDDLLSVSSEEIYGLFTQPSFSLGNAIPPMTLDGHLLLASAMLLALGTKMLCFVKFQLITTEHLFFHHTDYIKTLL